MDRDSTALRAARALTRATGAPLHLVDAEPSPVPSGAILLVDNVPTEDVLRELAQALQQARALVLWAPGWDQETAVNTLGRYGLEHGSVDVLGAPTPGALCVLSPTDEGVTPLVAALGRPERPFRALAVTPAFNEVDVIYHSIGAMVSEGIDVYLIDHNSTDGTAEAAAPWLGRGLVRIERFPDEAGYADRNRDTMVWREILRRVQEVSAEVRADWYLFHNADEFREAPWPGVTLLDALREVDELGYNAVNFEVYDFRPTDERYVPGDDPRRYLRHYDQPHRGDVLQIKAWKRQPVPVDLVEHGGHDLLFEGKRIFPIPFILRHYPIRSSEHGRRKVLSERLPRFASEERAGGWHVHYDSYADGASYLRDPESLTAWDGRSVRAELLARCMRELLLSQCLTAMDPARGEMRTEELCGWMRRRGIGGLTPHDLHVAQDRLRATAGGARIATAPELDRVAGELAVALEGQARLRGDALTAASLGDARQALRAA